MAHELGNLGFRHVAPAELGSDCVAHGAGRELFGKPGLPAHPPPSLIRVFDRAAHVGDERPRIGGGDPLARERAHRNDRPALVGLEPSRRIEVDKAVVEIALKFRQLKDRRRPRGRGEQQKKEHLNLRRLRRIPEGCNLVMSGDEVLGRRERELDALGHVVEFFRLMTEIHCCKEHFEDAPDGVGAVVALGRQLTF
ncbi:MAG: hypothetical protein ABL957_10520 [Parvularculaceae bacterium]